MMIVEMLGDGTVLLDGSGLTSIDEVRDAQSELAEWRARGHATVHVVGVPSAHVDRDELDAMGRRTVRLNIGHLLVVGEKARIIHLAAEHEGSWDGESLPLTDIDSAYDELTRLRGDGVVILVTGSTEFTMSALVQRFKEER